jgi:hypothetical protein
MTPVTDPFTIAVDETQLAKAIGMSVHFLRKDRREKRQIPFYRVGGSIRYNLDRVRHALAACEEGGARPRPRSPKKGQS